MSFVQGQNAIMFNGPLKFCWMSRLRLIDYGRKPVLDAETSLRDSSTEHRRGVGNTTELMTMATKLFKPISTLWRAASDAHLNLESHAGRVWMTLF